MAKARQSIKAKLKLFNFKNDYLQNNPTIKYKPISLEQFIRLIFERDGELPFQQDENKNDNFRYNAIAVSLDENNKASNFIIKSDLTALNELKGKCFAISSPISYIGRNRNANNTRFIFAYAFDIDGVAENQIIDLIHQMSTKHIPTANIIVNSGNGVHLYYLFKKPLALFPATKRLLKELKYRLTALIWNEFTSYIRIKQFQGIFQGFRIPETRTKFGKLVRAFKTEHEYYEISELNSHVLDPKNRLTDTELEIVNNGAFKKSKVTRDEAKKLFPQWYELRIVKGQKKGTWTTKPKLYEWWFNRLKTDEKVAPGHRYFCIMLLAIYAIKAGISYDRLKTDAYSLLDRMEDLTLADDNHFTKNDIDDALLAFKENYRTFPRRDMEMLSGLSIPKNKRNKRTQIIHLEGARAIQAINDKHKQISWRDNNGRKSKQEQVIAYQKTNPNANKAQCQRDTGIDKKTIMKYWTQAIQMTAKDQIIEWQITHPNATKAQCQRDTNFAYKTIMKYWTSTK